VSDHVVLDTSVASLAIRGDTRLAQYSAHYREGYAVLPLQAVAELRYGTVLAGWGEERLEDLERYVTRNLVAVPNDDIAHQWARVSAFARRMGRRLEAGDAWVAATAVYLGLPLLAHDLDFVDLAYPGLDVVCYAPRRASAGGP
jgi:predicted nucleic acid-binding protein